MTHRLRVSGMQSRSLGEGWNVAAVPAGSVANPSELDGASPVWHPAIVPGTAAAALGAAGSWSLDRPRDFDADDWWFQCRFPAGDATDRSFLRFDGLATLADVWLNDHHVLRSENMFLAHDVDVGDRLEPDNVVTVRCAALWNAPHPRRPRAQWRTKLVSDPRLRWFRTTLLGRIPGWSPPVAPVGPWRPVTLETPDRYRLYDVDLQVFVDGNDGVVRIDVAIGGADDAVPRAALVVGDHRADLEVAPGGSPRRIRGEIRVPDPRRWWPHTHGEPARYPAHVLLDDAHTIDLGHVGFRTVELDEEDGAFTVRINGVEVFCRGACWTTPDILTLRDTAEGYRESLTLARDAGMNMMRVGGTMVYEDDAFYDLCDELGILVWQDFMFANLDYPAADDGFAAGVRQEAQQVLGRLQGRPSVALCCGNSEIEQQAAMLGLPASVGRNALFADLLPGAVRERRPDVPYVPSTPSGGSLPFHLDHGVSHYYGVGAYRRPLDDTRRSAVRFTSECLGFANVPDAESTDAMLAGSLPVVHDPRWKERVPRDTGAGWDFEDVRDHYFQALLGVDPLGVRYADHERYLALSRVVTGQLMLGVFSEFRRPGSTCRGGLVWFWRDLWMGAGWGVVDATGRPKACFYFLQRALAPVALLLTDEGLNGLGIHVVNDTPEPVRGRVDVSLLRDGHVPVASGSVDVDVPAREGATLSADSLLSTFTDVTYAYRFGPPGHDVVVATLTAPDGRLIADTIFRPHGMSPGTRDDLGLTAVAVVGNDHRYLLTLASERVAEAVTIDVPGYRPDRNYVDVIPGMPRRITLAPTRDRAAFRGDCRPLNATAPTRIVEERDPAGRDA